MQRRSIICLLSGLSSLFGGNQALAQQSKPTTVTLYHSNWDTRLAASVITADATATTYKLGCPPSDPSTCGYASGVPTVTVVGGPSTAAQTLIIDSLGLSLTANCKLTAAAAGQCVFSDKSGALSEKRTADAQATDFGPVVVTAGLEKLAQATATGSGGTASGPTPKETKASGGSRLYVTASMVLTVGIMMLVECL